MIILIVDAFSSSPTGRESFANFSAGVKEAFRIQSHREIPTASGPTQFHVATLSSLKNYVYAYENNEFTDERAIGRFDKIDYIFVDADRRLMPWGDQTRPLLLLLKTAFFTRKCVFAAGGACGFVSFVLSNGGRKINVLNGNGKGSKLETMASFTPPSVVSPDDVFLDSTSGDYFQLDAEPNAKRNCSWIPVGSIGSHLHDVNANIQTGKFGVRAASPRKKTLTKPPHKCVPDYPVKAIMNGEVKIHIVRKHLQHKAFKGLATHDQLSFLAFCDNIWCLDTATNDRSRVRYEVIAESQHGPQLCTYDQIWFCQFHPRSQFSSTYKIMANFVEAMQERQMNEGKVSIGCDFLRQGDPNCKPKKTVMRPFSAPVSSKTVTASRISSSSQTKQNRANQENSALNKNKTTTITTARSKNTTSSKESTVVPAFDPLTLAANGYATPRFCTARTAITPREGVRVASIHDNYLKGNDSKNDDDITKLTSARTAEISEDTASGGTKPKFSKRLLSVGQRIGIDMTFANEHNSKIQEENDRLSILGYDDDGSESDSDESNESDQYYDYDDISNVDSWQNSTAPSRNRENVPPPPPPPHKTLDLSNIHNEIDWGTNVKVSDSSDVNAVEGSTTIKKVRLKSARRTPFCNKNKFDDLAAKDKTKDWYIFNDGTPYVSSSEQQIREDNIHRNRGRSGPGAGGGGQKANVTKEVQFQNVVGKCSSMPLPPKSGVVATGPYFGKVDCSSQLSKTDKSKFVGKKDWKAIGDRMKPGKCERKGGYWKK